MPGNDVCDFQQDFLFHTVILDPINGFGKGVDKKIKVGHCGTLDPFASGVLLLCTGDNTKNIMKYMEENLLNFSRNMVESHVLERNKYWTKFPTMESKHSEPEGRILSVNELLYNWRYAHAPVSSSAAESHQWLDQETSCQWWKERVNRKEEVEMQLVILFWVCCKAVV